MAGKKIALILIISFTALLTYQFYPRGDQVTVGNVQQPQERTLSTPLNGRNSGVIEKPPIPLQSQTLTEHQETISSLLEQMSRLGSESSYYADKPAKDDENFSQIQKLSEQFDQRIFNFINADNISREDKLDYIWQLMNTGMISQNRLWDNIDRQLIPFELVDKILFKLSEVTENSDDYITWIMIAESLSKLSTNTTRTDIVDEGIKQLMEFSTQKINAFDYSTASEMSRKYFSEYYMPIYFQQADKDAAIDMWITLQQKSPSLNIYRGKNLSDKAYNGYYHDILYSSAFRADGDDLIKTFLYDEKLPQDERKKLNWDMYNFSSQLTISPEITEIVRTYMKEIKPTPDDQEALLLWKEQMVLLNSQAQ